MAYPAQNIVTETPSVIYWESKSASSDWSPASLGSAIRKVEVNVRPATVINPVRPDGTRPPSAWNRRWGFLFTTGEPVHWRQSNGIEYRSPSAPVRIAMNGILTGAGARFISDNPGSVVRFPYNVEAEARTRTLLRLKDEKASLGIFLAELHKSVTFTADAGMMIMSAVNSGIKHLGAGRRAFFDVLYNKPVRVRPKGVTKRVWDARQRAVLKRWLEFQFAVKPLFSDIESSGAALSELLLDPLIPARFTVRGGAEEVASVLVDRGSNDRFWRTSAQFRGNALRTSRCHISATYDVPISNRRTIEQLGLGNPAVVAWELVQLSWMVDYIVQVGDWLESLTAAQGTRFVEGSIGRQMVVTFPQPVDVYSRLANASLLRGFGPRQINGELGRFNRRVLHDLYPAFRPPIRNRLNLTRLANVLAVLPSIASR